MIDPYVGGALVNAGASLFSNIFNKNSTDSANKNNLKIAQMNNQWSEKMFDKQIAYQTEMWNKENEYNTASAQFQRYKDAGLNPYMFMNGGNAGVAGSAGGVTPPSPQGVNYQASHYDFSGVGNAINSAIQLKQSQKLTEANSYNSFQQGRLLSNQADMYKIESMTKLNNLVQDTNNKFLKNEYQKIANSWADSTMNADYQNKVAQFDMMMQTIEGQRLSNVGQNIDNLIKSTELQYLPQRLKAEIKSVLQDIELKKSQGLLTDEQTRHEVEKKLKTISEKSGIDLNNEVIEKSSDALVNRNIKESMHSNPFGILDEFIDMGMSKLTGLGRRKYRRIWN